MDLNVRYDFKNHPCKCEVTEEGKSGVLMTVHFDLERITPGAIHNLFDALLTQIRELNYKRLPPDADAVYHEILRYPPDALVPSADEIAKGVNISVERVKKAIILLQQLDFLPFEYLRVKVDDT